MLPDRKNDSNQEMEKTVMPGFKAFWAKFAAEHKQDIEEKDFSKANYAGFPDEISSRPHALVTEPQELDQLRRAAASGNPKALQIIADQFFLGFSLPYNVPLALELYDLACEKLPNMVSLAEFRKKAFTPLNSVFAAAKTMRFDLLLNLGRRLTLKQASDLPDIEKQLEVIYKENPPSKQNQILLAYIYYFYYQQPLKIIDLLESLAKNDDEFAQIANFLLGYILLKTNHDNDTKVFEYFDNIETTSPWHNHAMQFYFMERGKELPSEFKNIATTSYHKALILRKHKEFAKSFAALCQAADEGSQTALVLLASVYLDGKGVNQNAFQAFRLVHEAATYGNATAQYFIARRYYDGDLVRKDFAEAFKYFSHAAAQNHTESCLYLATCYAKGYGTEVNPAKAAEYFRLGARTVVEIKELFEKYPSIPEVIYHTVLAIVEFEALKPNDKAVQAFNKLALENPVIFDKLMEKDNWENVKKAFHPEVAAVVSERQLDVFAKIHAMLQFKKLPNAIANKVLSFHTDFFQHNTQLIPSVNTRANTLFPLLAKKMKVKAPPDNSSQTDQVKFRQ